MLSIEIRFFQKSDFFVLEFSGISSTLSINVEYRNPIFGKNRISKIIFTLTGIYNSQSWRLYGINT